MTNPLYDALFGKYANSDNTFITTQDGLTISHRLFLARSAQFAHCFADMGLAKGDRVVAQVEKSVEALCIYAACVQSGLVFLPLHLVINKVPQLHATQSEPFDYMYNQVDVDCC